MVRRPPSRSKAPRSRSPRGPFPRILTSFVGRERELGLLGQLVSAHRLVTVVGPPGAGKTRVVTRLLESPPFAGRLGDVWFADLAMAATDNDVCAAVARALGLPVQGAGPSAAELGHVLAARPQGLLVLDNFEQVVDAAPATIGKWMAVAPALRMLVTSRELLRLHEEVPLELAPLGLPAPEATLEALQRSDAGQLFLQRAARYEPRQADAAVISQIVRRLEGLPLAIELAANWLNVLPPRELLARLDHRLELLSGGPRDAPRRHATLRAAIDWSWHLLAPWERSVVAQCAVFRGGIDVAAAEAVVSLEAQADAPAVLVALRVLVEKSLLRSWSDEAGAARLGMYELIREFVEADPGTAPDRAGAEARHLAHYATVAGALADEIDGARGADALRRLTAEYENLLVACGRALAPAQPPDDCRRALDILVCLERVVFGRMPVTSYGAMLDRALERCAAVGAPAAVVARARVARSRVHYALGRFAESEADLHDALELARTAGDDGATARALWRLGVLFELRQLEDRARRSLEDALLHAQRARDPQLEVEILVPLAHLYSDHGRHDDALDRCRLALRIARAHHSRRLQARAHGAHVLVYMRAGKAEQSRAELAKMLPLVREVGEHLGEGYGYMNAGIACQELGRFDEARGHFERARAIARQVGQERLAGAALGNLGALHHELGELATARSYYEQALALVQASGARRLEGEFGAQLACLEARCDRLDEAREHLSRAARRLGATSDPSARGALELYRAQLDLALARQAAARGDGVEALRIRGTVLRLASQPAVRSEELRLAARLLRGALAREAYVVHPEGSWFAPPATERVSLARRAPLQRLLRRLFEHHRAAPGTGLSQEDLVAAGWPAESLRWDAALNRLHVALTTLRKLGLRDVLQFRDDRYLLDPTTLFISSIDIDAGRPVN